jgi:2,5-diketo-D-gluconate reductase A
MSSLTAEAAPRVPLIHGALMPQIGLGTYPLDDRQAELAVTAAIARGYRLIDTSYFYGNEVGVGRGLRASGVPRTELFVTSKFDGPWHGVREVRDAFALATHKLGVDYIDLFLIHWPLPWLDRYVEAFRGLAVLLEEGLLRAIGTSNFSAAHLARVIEETGVVPDVNQVKLNPMLTREALRTFHRKHGIVTESWSPLDRAGALLRDPLVVRLAERHARTPAQVLLRWQLESGLVAVVGSGDPSEIAEDIDIFDFALSAEELGELAALDQGDGAAPDAETAGH